MNIQKQQFFNLLILSVLGITYSNFYLLYYEGILLLLFTLFISYFIEKEVNKNISFSALVTTIGIWLMMVSIHLWVYFIIIFFALLQKKYLKIDHKPIFNPSNFALVFGLFFYYDDAHIVLGQLGNEWWLMGVLILMAGGILIRVNRWFISLSFTLFYLFFQYFLIVDYDSLMLIEDIGYRFYSISFVLFILFMLTDPKTTPNRLWNQAIFTFFIALLTTLLDRYYGFRVQHVFLSLFFFSLFVPLLTSYSKRVFLETFFIAFIAIVVIIIIENRVPYYFSMNG